MKVQLAYTMSKYWHRSQFRKELDEFGEPVRYFEHVRRTALVLIDEASCFLPEMIISSLLHDSIEDTRDEDLSADMIEENFGEDVIKIVKTLSKVPKNGYTERFILSNDWRPYLIKACDRLDNLRSLSGPNISDQFILKQIEETRTQYMPIFQRMMDLIPKEYACMANSIRYKIEQKICDMNV